jgi:hypothetical protein
VVHHTKKGENKPNDHKIYQNGHKINHKAIKYTKWSHHIPKFFISRPSNTMYLTKLGFVVFKYIIFGICGIQIHNLSGNPDFRRQ